VGSVLPGVVTQTWLRGEKVFERGEIVGDPRGRLLLRNHSTSSIPGETG
jgi:hypothetical protein